MPYKASTYRRRRYPAKRRYTRRYRRPNDSWSRWFQKGVTPVQAGAAALAGVNYLAGLVNAEMYKYDINETGANLTSSGQVSLMCGIAQGDSEYTRTGNSIFVRSFNLDGDIKFNSAGNPQQVVKIALIMDKQQVGDTAPAIGDIYQQVTPHGHLNASTVGRFSVLFSRIYKVDASNPTAIVKINKAMRQHIRFNGSAAADVQKNALYLIWISDQASANYPTIRYTSRLSYHDN